MTRKKNKYIHKICPSSAYYRPKFHTPVARHLCWKCFLAHQPSNGHTRKILTTSPIMQWWNSVQNSSSPGRDPDPYQNLVVRC